jgi:orotate phosphoribosyltransferase
MGSGDSKRDQSMTDTELTVLAREIDARCRLHGSFVLRSGQVTSEYFDKYLFECDPELLGRVAEQMSVCLPAGTQLLGGLELGGVPLAVLLSQFTGLPALFVRKQAKAYGTARLAEGPDPAGKTVTLIEDVITTGGTVAAAARALRDLGATVHTVVCAIDRSPRGRDPLAAEGLRLLAVFDTDFLDFAVRCAR